MGLASVGLPVLRLLEPAVSINAYTGLPGSGKSYNVVEHVVLPALKEGRIVVTNLPLHEEVVAAAIPGADLREISLERLVDNPGLIDELFPAGCVCVLDECWRLWPAGQKVNNIPQEFKSFLAEHRHRVDAEGRSMQVVLVTQDLAQIAAFARQLVEQTFIHTKLTHLGMDKKFKVSIAHGAVTGTIVPENRQLVTRLGTYKADVWKFYKSHTMSKAGKDGADETAVDGRGNVFKRPGLIALGVLGLLCLGFGGTWVYGVTQDPAAAVGGTVGDRPQQPHSSGVVTTGAAVVPAVQRWRVSGWLLGENPTQSRVLITDGVAAVWVPFASYCRQERTGVVACVVNGRFISSAALAL